MGCEISGFGIRVDKFENNFIHLLFLAQDTLKPSYSQTRISKTRIPKPDSQTHYSSSFNHTSLYSSG